MDLMSLADVAKEIGIPESNARYYRNKYSDYLPSVGTGRARRYKPEAVKVLRMIAEGFKSQLPAEAIEEQLQTEFGIPTQPTTKNKQQMTVSPKMLDLVSQQQKQIAVTMEQLQELKAENKQLREEFSAYQRATGEQLRMIAEAQQQQQAPKSLWQRLFGG